MSVILALYPNTKGLGFACIEKPMRLVDAGILNVRPICNFRLLNRTEKIIDFYRPMIILVREPSTLNRQSKRVADFVAEIEKLAIVKNLPVRAYSRKQVKEVFNQFNAGTKHEISQRVIEAFPELADRAPAKRKIYMDEPHNMGLFDAMALGITHLYLSE